MIPGAHQVLSSYSDTILDIFLYASEAQGLPLLSLSEPAYRSNYQHQLTLAGLF